MEDLIITLLLARAAKAVYEDDFENYKKCGQAIVLLTDEDPAKVAALIAELVATATDEEDDFEASVLQDIEAL